MASVAVLKYVSWRWSDATCCKVLPGSSLDVLSLEDDVRCVEHYSPVYSRGGSSAGIGLRRRTQKHVHRRALSGCINCMRKRDGCPPKQHASTG